MPDSRDIYLEMSDVVLSRSYTKPHEVKPERYVRISFSDEEEIKTGKVKRKIFYKKLFYKSCRFLVDNQFLFDYIFCLLL